MGIQFPSSSLPVPVPREFIHFKYNLKGYIHAYISYIFIEGKIYIYMKYFQYIQKINGNLFLEIHFPFSSISPRVHTFMNKLKIYFERKYIYFIYIYIRKYIYIYETIQSYLERKWKSFPSPESSRSRHAHPFPDWKKFPHLAYSCPRDWRSSLSP